MRAFSFSLTVAENACREQEKLAGKGQSTQKLFRAV